MKQMKKSEPIRLRDEVYEELRFFADLLGKKPDALVEDVLLAYFEQLHRSMAEQNGMDDNAQTNLSYDEFWDGVEL